jgi:hypothetical protein
MSSLETILLACLAIRLHAIEPIHSENYSNLHRYETFLLQYRLVLIFFFRVRRYECPSAPSQFTPKSAAINTFLLQYCLISVTKFYLHLLLYEKIHSAFLQQSTLS